MKKRSPIKMSFLAALLMFVGVLPLFGILLFMDNKAMTVFFIILSVVIISSGLILHFVYVRCPHCGSYLGRIIGSKCPFCGKNIEK